MRLIDDLAARRVLYRRPLTTMPDVLLIDIPPAYGSPSLPLGRFFPVILETEAEYREMQAFLEQDRPQLAAPSLFDRRPSMLRSDAIVFARYAPPGAGWPWLLLCHWPEDCIALVPPGGDHFARGSYTIEVLATLPQIERAETQLRTTLGACKLMDVAARPDITGHC